MLKDLTSSKFEQTVDSETVTLQAIQGPINGEYGKFYTVTIDEEQYNVDANKLHNKELFKTNCKAEVTTSTYKNKKGEEKTYISALTIQVPDKCGFFLLS